jgi:hypothetical protein
MTQNTSSLPPIERKVLTLYGSRDFPEEPGDIETVRRGIAHLNGYVHELMRDNPGLLVESVSHTHLHHPGPAGRPDLARLWFFATIVYSGEITNTERLTFYEEERAEPRLFDENSPAYGSVIYVEL